MYGSYCLWVPSDQDRKMISAAFPETPLCWMVSLRLCMQSVACDFLEDEEHCCEVVSTAQWIEGGVEA